MTTFGKIATAAIIIGIAVVLIRKSPADGPLPGWSTNLESAITLARIQKKCVLVEFTGSDWCPPCMQMRKNVFSKQEFINAANIHYILVELDFPKRNAALAEKNRPYTEKYQVTGFPTVILLNPDGVEFNRFYASEFPDTAAFLAHLAEARSTQIPATN